jgi:hypothetical protein
MLADKNRKLAFLYDLHPAESFPLILGFIILLQQTSFVAIQAAALDSIFIKKCRNSSQVVLTRKSFYLLGSLNAKWSRNFYHWLFPFRLRPGDDNPFIKTEKICAEKKVYDTCLRSHCDNHEHSYLDFYEDPSTKRKMFRRHDMAIYQELNACHSHMRNFNSVVFDHGYHHWPSALSNYTHRSERADCRNSNVLLLDPLCCSLCKDLFIVPLEARLTV